MDLHPFTRILRVNLTALVMSFNIHRQHSAGQLHGLISSQCGVKKPEGPQRRRISAADIDGDGRPDLIFAEDPPV
jgi:hypothetical protein